MIYPFIIVSTRPCTHADKNWEGGGMGKKKLMDGPKKLIVQSEINDHKVVRG